MRIEISRNIADIPLDKETWNKLVSTNATNSIFQTYEWFISWWECFENDNDLIFLVAYENNSINAFAPLMLSNSTLGSSTIKFVGDGNSDYCDFVIKGNRNKAINAFLSYLDTSNIKWTSFELNNIPSNSTSRACIESFCINNNLHVKIRNSTPTPTLILNKNIEDVKKLTKKYSVTRHVNKLNKAGNVTFDHLTDKESIKLRINDFFDQHINRYNLKGTKSLFKSNNNREFYLNIINKLDNTNWLLFSILYLDEEPIAYHLGFTYNKSFIWYKPSFDIKYRTYSPGTVLLKNLIEYSIKESMDEFDFTIGDEVFKSRFSNFKGENYNLSIYKSKALYNACSIRHLLGYIFNRIKIKLVK
ncbi:MAG: GNAT family N-acetyltransferase [Gammaproteobacteria bacterium]|nr:GNAT family N-acetyltransferase [Gammaproteobacteria bacterium]